jgi:hypothetical protein
MAGALEGSITLEDVFVMVGSRKVPLAPELAGYLALEIAEGADEAGGDVDPRSVYIAEEGTVALVKRRDARSGDPEGSIRVILGRLLDASGAKTPALTAAARRRSTGNLHALAEELEAALIPVNRAAGRRALARLAREVKRVAMRVGRSPPAHPPPTPESTAPTKPPPAFPAAEPTTAKREVPAEVVQAAVPSSNQPGGERPPSQRPVSMDIEDLIEESKPDAQLPSEPAPSSRRPGRPSEADVDSLLEQFSRGSERPDRLVARDLKAMAGLDPTPPPPPQGSLSPRTGQPSERPSDAGVEALLALSEPLSGPGARPPTGELPPIVPPPARGSGRHPASQPPSTPAQAPISKRAAAARRSGLPPERALDVPTPLPSAPSAGARVSDAPGSEPGPARSRRLSQAEIPTGADLRHQAAVISRISTGEFRRMKKRRSDLWLVAVLLGLIGIGVSLVWSLKPGFFTGRTAEKVALEKAATEAARLQAIANQQAQACKVALQVTDVPANAEVLLRQGQAPVDVERMPVGARLEFVATAEGFAPKRAVVPAGVSWDTGGGGKPRYEVAVQLDKSSGKPKGDIWPPGEPGSTVGGQGPPGTVHIVTTPRGAEVWLLAGMGPEARIEPGTPCDQDVDVLVAGPTTLRKRIHIPAASFVTGADAPPEGRFAKVSAGLGEDAGGKKGK